MKKRLLRQLCRILNFSDDFIRRHKKIFKALLNNSDSSGSSESKEKFVPIYGLNSDIILITDVKHERDSYYSYQLLGTSILNKMLITCNSGINTLFGYPVVSANVNDAIQRFNIQYVLFYYNNDLYGGCFYFDGDNLRIITNKLLDSYGRLIIRVPISEQLYIKQ